MATKEQKARDTVAEWVRSRIGGEAAVAIPEVAREALDHFGGDVAFIRALVADQLYGVFYGIAQDVVASTRMWVPVGNRAVNVGAAPEAYQAARRSIFERWLEHTGSENKKFMDLTKADALAAVKIRLARAESEARVGRLLDSLAKGLKKRDEKIRDRYTVAEVEARWRQINDTHQEVA